MHFPPFSPPRRAVISFRLPNSWELIPAGADSVYIQRCSDKPYQPAQLKRSRARKEGLAAAHCQPHWAPRIFSCLFPSPWGLCSEQGATKPPVLVRVAMAGFIQQSLELLALMLVQIMERKKGRVLQAGGNLQALSPKASHPVPPHTRGSTSPYCQLPWDGVS